MRRKTFSSRHSNHRRKASLGRTLPLRCIMSTYVIRAPTRDHPRMSFTTVIQQRAHHNHHSGSLRLQEKRSRLLLRLISRGRHRGSWRDMRRLRRMTTRTFTEAWRQTQIRR